MRLTDDTAQRPRSAAKDPATPPDSLARLVRDPEIKLAAVAAANPSLPRRSIIDAVGEAVRQGDERLLCGLASNPNLPTDAMFALVRHGNAASLTELAGNPSADIAVLAAIREADKTGGYTLSRKHTLINIVKHPACSIELLREVFDARVGISSAFMYHCLEHSNLPTDLIDEIADGHLELFRSCNRPKRIWAIHESDLEMLHKSIAAHPNTPPLPLAVLATQSDPRLAALAAANPSLPECSTIDAVAEVVRHDYGCLYCDLATRPSLTRDAMFEIIRYGHIKCLAELATNPSADIAVLTAVYQRVMQHEDIWRRGEICTAIAENPACDVELAQQMFENDGVDIFVPEMPRFLFACLRHADLRTEAIDAIAEEWQYLRTSIEITPVRARRDLRRKLMEVGVSIAARPSTSLAVLALLAMDSDARLAAPALNQIQQRRRTDPTVLNEAPITSRGPILGIADVDADADASNSSLSEREIIKAVQQAIQRGSDHLLGGLASKRRLPRSAMFEILRNGNAECLTELAGNPSADIAVLAAIRDADKACGYTPSRKDTLVKLVKHPACNIELIRDVLGGRVGITPELLYHCMGHADLPPDLIEEINERQHKLLARHRTATNRAHLPTKHELESIRESIAAHPNTPLALLTVFAMDPNPRLAKPALKRIQERRRSDSTLFDQPRATSEVTPLG